MLTHALKFMVYVSVFATLAGLGAVSHGQTPVVDGLSEVRAGVVDKIDTRAKMIVIDGRQYQLVEDQQEVLANLLGSTADVYSKSIRMQSIVAGDTIRYVVDVMAERLGHQAPELFILSVE